MNLQSKPGNPLPKTLQAPPHAVSASRLANEGVSASRLANEGVSASRLANEEVSTSRLAKAGVRSNTATGY
jgi:hypothetical protein